MLKYVNIYLTFSFTNNKLAFVYDFNVKITDRYERIKDSHINMKYFIFSE